MGKINAKEILKDKFWIVEDEGVRVGTLSIAEDTFMFSDKEGTHFFNEKQLKKKLGKEVSWQHLEIKESYTKEVHNYPTSCVPYNPMFDVKRKLPLFTKSAKSKSVYCAGYYIIRFDKGWVKSFCPKLITVERYDYQGPFKTEIEMRQKLSIANAK
jgi:hypothetical protein